MKRSYYMSTSPCYSQRRGRSYIYFANDGKTDTLIQITFWLVVVSSALGIINYRQTVK